MFAVVRRNPQFRRLWLAQVVSQAGDWLNRIALLTLISRLGERSDLIGLGMLYGIEIALRLLPPALFGSVLAGTLADRLPRRLIMIAADLLRAAIVLGLITVKSSSDLPLLYALLIAQMSVSSFFEAARSAATPNTLPREELHEGYALSAATWSAMLGFGALLGGILVDSIDVRGVFIVDALTYTLSAAILWKLKLPKTPSQPKALHWSDMFLLQDMRRGLQHARSLGIARILAAKTFWGACGGYLVMLSVVGSERFGQATSLFNEGTGAALDVQDSTGLATGALFGARGLGTAIGPILARRFFGSTDASLRWQISAGFGIAAVGYALFALADQLLLALAWVAFAHMGGSMLWIASTTIWQKRVADAFRGRVYALELLGMTLAFSLGAILAGGVYDWTESIEVTLWVVCGLVLSMGALWTLLTQRVSLTTQ